MKLSHKEAWIEVGRRIENSSEHRGICGVIDDMCDVDKTISNWRRRQMLRMIARLSAEMKSAFVWPLTAEGKKARAQYCYRQASGRHAIDPLL